MNLARAVLRHRPAILLTTVMITLGGLWAVRRLPAGIYPEAEFNRIVLVVNGGTFEPRDMVVAVTRPLEEALIGVIDLRRLRSRTVRGGAELSLDFRPGADMGFALQQVQGRVGALLPELPPGLHTEVERLTSSVFPILQFELRGADPVVLRDLAQYTIRPRLARLADVGTVEVQGGLVREIAVEAQAARLVAQRLPLTALAAGIRAGNSIVAAGRLDREYRQFSVEVSGLADGPAAVGALVLRAEGATPLRVRDVASVQYGTEDQFQLAAGNGEPAALINVARQPTGSILDVEAAALATVDSLRTSLPAGVRMDLVYDLGSLVRESIASVRDAILVGGLLAALVLFLFLGRPSLTIAASATVPLAIAGTFGGLYLLGDSLNLMSLGGIAVAVGLIIDDAVVVVENLERHLPADGRPLSRDLVERGLSEILGPVTSSTLTTVVVFAPLGLLEGVVGQFFRSFSLALAVAVLLSLLYATTLLPAVIERLARPVPGRVHRAWLRLDALSAAYARMTRSLLRRPWSAVAAVLGLLVVGGVVATRLETGFLPDMDEGGFILDYWSPTGTSLTETDRQLHLLEQILRQDDAIAAFTRRTGAELGLFATAPNRGDLTVLLKPLRSRTASVYEVMDRVRRHLEARLPALRIEFHQVQADLLGDLTGSPDPVELKLFHPDVRVAEAAGRTVAARVEGVPGLEDLFDGVQGDLPAMTLQVDPARAARLGLSTEEVGAQAQAAMFGAGAGAVRETDRLVGIRVRLPDADRASPSVLTRVPVIGPAGWAPLGTLGRVADTSEISELTRENLRPYVAVTGAVDVTRSSLGTVMSEIRRALQGVPLPAGSSLEYGGQEAGQRESFRQLLAVFALAAGLVLLVMVIHFRNVRAPVLILAGSLPGIAGAGLALALTGTPFNVSSFMGLILLVGLVVKNGIIFYDAARNARAELDPVEALVAAGRVRLRPILMTTLCTLTGLLPLAFGFGAGADLQRPLAIAVIGGLSLSAAVTLFLLPSALLWFGALSHAD
ncbi:MAG TPA: efflux RND transporter permease subunit [Gemmatimonadales bacterium]|nr:efflux RND transporter permease subunit [Gemmatimonadales bacterium]